MPRKAIIIGAGPAGLTAAYELLKRTNIVPIILEKSEMIGGISRTINYKGNRMDMGPHRFFSKSDRVMNWWLNILPMEETLPGEITISYQNKSRQITTNDPTPQKDPDKVMLIINRITRIYFLRKFFGYPIQLSLDTLRTLGLIRTIKILLSFIWIRIFPRKPEKSLEDFIVNKFGKQLYLLFFKDYTEKVWGIEPAQISAEWGAQRIKGVSLSKAISHALKSAVKRKAEGVSQKSTETSLIEQFLYPKHGPGSLWEEVARQVQEMGGKIYFNQDVKHIHVEGSSISSVITHNSLTGQTGAWEGEFFFSSMPVQELIAGMGSEAPQEVRDVAEGLQYRDFINVGVLLKQMTNKEGRKLDLKDNWIYIQERDVKVGRLMIYNNWGGGMIKDPNTVWIGMEYFCTKNDKLWSQTDDQIKVLAIQELEKMALARPEEMLDITVQRMEKTYPAYFGTYNQFDKIKSYIDHYTNLFLVGRNGMHKYNNADHSMLTAMVAVDNIEQNILTKHNLWAINTEQEFHEEKKAASQPSSPPKIPAKPVTVPYSFSSYIKSDKFNRALLWMSAITILVELLLFKYFYPFAGFINGDSYNYLQSALFNYDINTYPVGYSKFLRLFSAFTKSDTLLVAFQYLAIQASALWLTTTLFWILSPSRLVKTIMLLVIVVNPVFLYVSNYISSDALFLASSLVWFTLLLRILIKPTLKLVIWEVVILFVAFIIRYNALYYPLIAVAVLLMSRQSLGNKFIGIGASIILIAYYVSYVSVQFQQLTGIRQFTPFSGWQLANNAMYAYRFVDSNHIQPAPQSLQSLDRTVRTYFDTSRNLKTHPMETLIASTVYMWDPRSPLVQFMTDRYKKDSTAGRLKRWASMAPLYSQYGSYLIRRYPTTFLKYFLVPNALKYYAPPGEFLDDYNMGRDTVATIAQGWFGYKTNKVYTAFKNNRVTILAFMPIFAGLMNAIFLVGLLSFLMLQGVKRNKRFGSILLVTCALWGLNFVFSVFASPITLRYQLFSIVIVSLFALLLVDFTYKMAFVAIEEKK
jgi:protoporphyrinogen oxidase